MTIKRKSKFIILPKIIQETNPEESKPQEQNESNKKIKR